MKRMRIISIGLVVSCLVAIGVMSTASAMWSPNFMSSGDTSTVPKDTTHKGSLYATGNAVTIDGTITGSLYCAGNTVTINGTVDGDVLCAGQKITINGTVGQDVRVAGQFVQVNGKISGSLTSFGQDIGLAKDAQVEGDINGAGQQFTLDGTVGRDVALGTQLLALNGEVRGNVDVAMQQLQFGNGATVLGNMNYGSQKELSFDASHVKGKVSFNLEQNNHRQDNRQFAAAAKIGILFMLAVSAFIMMLLIPRFINRSSELFARQRLMTILLGFAAVFGMPIIAVFLLTSFVLIPLGVILLFGWISMLVLSGIFFAYWIGAELLRSQSNLLVRMLGGIVVLFVVYMIPFLNVLVMFTATIVGSGMIVATLTSGYKRPSYRVAAKKTTAPAE